MNRVIAIALTVAAGISVGVIAVNAGARVGLTSEAGTETIANAVPADTGMTVAATPVPSQLQLAQVTPVDRAAIEAIVREYLISNPEIIRDAINELQRREDEAARLAQTQAISANSSGLFSTAGDVVLGNPDGDVTLVEFFDYNCTYCRRAHADMQQLIANDPNLRVVLKEFPVLGDGSIQAAKVSVAVLLSEPERYGEFHDALIRETGQVDGDWALAVAADIGIDPQVLRATMDGEEVMAVINESYALGGQLNLTGTPSYVTNKQVIVGAVGYDALRAYLDDARDCVTTAIC